MTLRCHACDKLLLRYAVSNVGADGVEYGWGPRCGRDVMVRKRREAKAKTNRTAPVRDPHTRDWVNEARASQHP